ncbi:hypothetical protein E4U33_005775 [Claviceps sp. LM78 group G4]|nr:hypothetical protein E4U33_005775 [Claviceps sp. LM78 group G4]
MPPSPPLLTPSPPAHQSSVTFKNSKEKPITSQSTSGVDKRIACRDTAASARPLAAAVTPLARVPLPGKPPKATKVLKPLSGGTPPLPRFSASPAADNKSIMATVDSPSLISQGTKISMTSKEWIIPPRPKPGRKPATDTPPTRRKAQNRAAQRAFRERRAARVGELEQQLDEIKDGYHKEEGELKDKIHSLELDLQSFRSRCLLLENMLDRERQDRIRAETEAETLRRRHSDDLYRSHSINGPSHAYCQNPSSAHHHTSHFSSSDGRNPQYTHDRSFSISQITSPPLGLDISSNTPDADAALTCGNCSPNGRCACAEEALASASVGCGKCSFGSPCECLDQVLGEGRVPGQAQAQAQGQAQEQGKEQVKEQGQGQGQAQELKRPSSPSATWSGGKRQHRASAAAIPPITETDFTTTFSRQQRPAPSTIVPETSYEPSSFQIQAPSGTGDAMSFREKCGFCEDGTYCVCAEDAAGMATPAMTPFETPHPSSHQAQTPPPSEPDVPPPPTVVEMTADGAVKLPRRGVGKKPARAAPSSTGGNGNGNSNRNSSSGCGTNGPGTCAQCQADPKSGLFCRLMNAKYSREQGSSSSGGCCGGKGAGGGCCKSDPPPEKITLPSLPTLGLSCAEAYQTLSSHRNFSKAADDISSWLPKLKTTVAGPVGRGGPVSGRQAVEVEAASIMSVLKEFDIRFGREA